MIPYFFYTGILNTDNRMIHNKIITLNIKIYFPESDEPTIKQY